VSMPAGTILVIGTLDTKGAEIAFVAAQIERLGARALVLDSGTGRADTSTRVDIRRETVAHAGGTSMEELARSASRGEAIARMAQGVRAVVSRMHAEGEIDGALCIGGAGATLATAAFEALPVGFPKMIVSPLASGPRNFEMFVGTRDVVVMHSVCDIIGINPISEPVFRQAAGAIVGMVNAAGGFPDGWAGKYVAATMNGNTTEAVSRIRTAVAANGVELVIFHANGTGGRAMERAIVEGRFDGVLDFTTTELSGEQFGGMMSSGPDRMEVAGRHGIPQVLVPGCIDMLTDGRYDDVVRRYPGRRLYRHNPELTLIRLDRDHMADMGRVFGRKALAAKGPVRVVVPLGGLSIPDSPGGAFWDPDADAAFVEALQTELNGAVELECVDAHINAAEFTDRVVAHLTELVLQDPESSRRINAHR
jgi:uncharacterized protein (UPF0261 family)